MYLILSDSMSADKVTKRSIINGMTKAQDDMKLFLCLCRQENGVKSSCAFVDSLRVVVFSRRAYLLSMMYQMRN